MSTQLVEDVTDTLYRLTHARLERTGGGNSLLQFRVTLLLRRELIVQRGDLGAQAVARPLAFGHALCIVLGQRLYLRQVTPAGRLEFRHAGIHLVELVPKCDEFSLSLLMALLQRRATVLCGRSPRLERRDLLGTLSEECAEAREIVAQM